MRRVQFCYLEVVAREQCWEIGKCGIATKLLKEAHGRMQECFQSTYCSLHVRYTNVADFIFTAKLLVTKSMKLKRGIMLMEKMRTA